MSCIIKVQDIFFRVRESTFLFIYLFILALWP